MNFKETLNHDLDHTFFANDEFSELCSWGNQKIRAVIDDDDLISKYSDEFETLPQAVHLVYVAENQFNTKPKVNEAVLFNNNLYTIVEIKKNFGMLAIFLKIGRG